MTTPQMHDEQGELSEAARRLIAEEASLDEPTADALHAFEGRLFGALGVPAPSAEPPGGPDATSLPPPAAAPSASWLGGLGGKLALAACVGALTVAGHRLLTRPSAIPTAASPAPAGAVAAPPASVRVPVPVAVSVETPAASGGAAEVVGARRPHAAARDDSLEAPAAHDHASEETPAVVVESPAAAPGPLVDEASEEALLLATAEAQLRAGHTSAALSLYDRALGTHPRGQLRAEAQAGRIVALCRLGRTDEGRAALARFVESNPRAPSLTRLRSSCGVSD